MNATEIAAYLGASSWIPQVFGWFYKFFVKPLIIITPDKTVSIGYTTFGPIFNLRLSVNVDRKDTLIDFMGVELRHSDGSAYYFEWAGMYEFFSEVKSSKGDNQVIHRDTTPITIKLSTLSPAERFFRFRETKFIELIQPFSDKLTEHQTFLQKNNRNYHDELLNSKQIDDYLKFTRESFWWKAGTYEVKFSVRSPSRVKLIKNSFKFNLSQDNIDSMKKNLDEIKTAIEFAIKKDDISDFTGQPGSWNWLNPILKRTKK